jgi:hypothetical protein
MPLLFSCDCGKTLRVADEHAGKRTRCPACARVLTVPEGILVEEAEPPVPRRNSVAVQREPPPEGERPRPRKGRDYEVVEGEPPTVLPAEPRSVRRRPRMSDDDEVHHPRGQKAGGGSSGLTDKGVIGGLAMIGISIVWLVVGLFFGWLFYKPLILLVIGLVTFIKGLIDGNVFGE